MPAKIRIKKWEIDHFKMSHSFKYLGMTAKYRNLIQEEIKRRLNSGNACYHLVQNLLSSRLLSKNVKVRMYKTVLYIYISMIHCSVPVVLKQTLFYIGFHISFFPVSINLYQDP
jgi:hypothetical protein